MADFGVSSPLKYFRFLFVYKGLDYFRRPSLAGGANNFGTLPAISPRGGFLCLLTFL